MFPHVAFPACNWRDVTSSTSGCSPHSARADKACTSCLPRGATYSCCPTQTLHALQLQHALLRATEKTDVRPAVLTMQWVCCWRPLNAGSCQPKPPDRQQPRTPPVMYGTAPAWLATCGRMAQAEVPTLSYCQSVSMALAPQSATMRTRPGSV